MPAPGSFRTLPFTHYKPQFVTAQQKIIIITGASRGIGYDTALQLLKQENTVVVALARDAERLQALRAAAGTDRLQWLVQDITREPGPELLQRLSQYGPISGLINNAGLLINAPFTELTAQNWQDLFAVNVLGPAALIRLLSDHFAPGAHIVNIGSMGGYQGSSKFPGLSGYSAAKAALATLTECLAEEWKERGIRVNCLALGAVQTEMLAAAFPGYEAPLSSDEMAAFLAYFVREGHRYFNGKVLPVSVSTP